MKMKTAKQEYLEKEADAYFERNKASIEKMDGSVETKFFAKFMQRMPETICAGGGLEIGSCSGYNLAYLLNIFPKLTCVGIEPSQKAMDYGSEKYSNLVDEGRLRFIHGTSDSLPFEDASFKVIIVGFCLYQADRNLFSRMVSEIDRCLEYDGLLVITDFDVLLNAQKANKHNAATPVFKQNYAKLFEVLGYSVIEKTTLDAGGKKTFPIEMDDRFSIQILYKEKIESIYK